MSASTLVRPDVTLTDRYEALHGPVLISGVQALVRLALDQRRLDQRRGWDTGVYVSGYPGSPLGGLDQEFRRAEPQLRGQDIVFHTAVNEELAATAVGGTQLLDRLSRASKAGITGFWYGKNPGFDRAADAIRHATLSGTAPLGGAVALIGDDPSSKSSTVPSSCEPMCRSMVMPVLAPGSVAEILELGLHAVAMSREAGLWTGLKIVADIADATETVDVGAALETIAFTDVPAAPRTAAMLLPPTNLDAELDLMTARLQRANAYALDARLNRIVFEPRRARVGIVAAGMGHAAVLRALTDLGFDEGSLDAAGIRLIKLGMPWPLDTGLIRELVAGLETVLVVEDKLPFVESQIKEALYRAPHQPLVIGKHDGNGHSLLPARSALTADELVPAITGLLEPGALPAAGEARLAQLAARDLGWARPTASDAARTPYFCSGCPHNTSTRAGADDVVGAGIGCHILAAADTSAQRGDIVGMVQMGGEGAQFFGLAPFAPGQHFTQNLGDGTFHHSGSLAIRAAVDSGASITYRLLYNEAVAMTGGQKPIGNLAIPALVSELALEGVRQVVICTPEPERYDGVALDPIASVRHRDALESAAAELATGGGVTVIVYDDRCATEKRRLRKRGKLETPPERVWINERVCEGCGDCGEQSTCLSVQPVATAYGRKTRIHQGSCNQDLSCLKGDCPSFTMVTPKGGARPRPAIVAPPVELPEPVRRVGDDVLIRMDGVGGTGVVTTSAILQMAAHLDGRHAAGLEQIGLAQKGGPVISDIRITTAPIEGQLRASRHSVDVLLGFDLLGASDLKTLETLRPGRAIAILNEDVTPTATMVFDVHAAQPSPQRLARRVGRIAGDVTTIAAETIADSVFGDHMPANMILVGAAYQRGCLPLSPAAIDHAIELNGAAVETNRAAFAWGRAAVADPDAVARALDTTSSGAGDPAPDETLDALVARLTGDLTAYQDAGYARAFADSVQRVAVIERERTGSGDDLVAAAYARGLHKLMAYKDEYEVARLHLDTTERARLDATFGPGAKVQVMLHPPVLRALGMDRKIRLGRSARPLFTTLRAARKLRGTALDPFGRAAVRRVERELVGEYKALVGAALEQLHEDNRATVIQIAELPDLIRGYEQIKLDNIARMRAEADRLAAELRDHAPATPSADAPIHLEIISA